MTDYKSKDKSRTSVNYPEIGMESKAYDNGGTNSSGAENMLILARKTNECIMIGDQIEIFIVDIKGDQVKVGINAPTSIKIYRQEVYKAIQLENIKAMETKPDILPKLDNLLGKNIKNTKDPVNPPNAGNTKK